MLLRAGSHLVVVGAQHELLMEQDRFRSQFWAAFDAFVPGTPLYLSRERVISGASRSAIPWPGRACGCRRLRRRGRRRAAARFPRW